jgi:glucokinase
MMASACAIGVDIGATHTKIGLVEPPGRLLDLLVIPSNLKGRDPAHFLSAAFVAVAGLAGGRRLGGIGISLCSLINQEHTGALLSVNAPALNGLDIQAAFAGRFGVPVCVINDVNAFALAEHRLGAGRGVERLLCLGLGTGLAIACILDGRVIETWGGVAADVGRLILDPGSEYRCNGGVHGSAEALCGTAHIERLAHRAYGRAATAREVIAAAREGQDPLAARILAEIGAHAGHLLAILSPVFFPQRILITGGTAEAGEPLFAAARERYADLIGAYMADLYALEGGERRPVEIVKGALGPEAAVIGAVLGFFALLKTEQG